MEMNITVRECDCPAQIYALVASFLAEIGEAPLDEGKKARLANAMKAGNIVFFIASTDTQAIGMCSVAPCWSTFACGETGVFDDFYVSPAFRGKGIARKLAQAAQGWCRAHGCASVTVSCAPCDVGMYTALGFDVSLGTTLAAVMA